MAKQEFLMLAHKFNEKKHRIGGTYISDKLDGFRIFSDGGISRGVPKSEVPWANTSKDDRYVDEQIATGLWTRQGNVVHAPEWFLDQLPPIFLDGELYSYTLSRQELFSLCKKLVVTPAADVMWRKHVVYKVFDLPPYERIMASRELNWGTIDKEACDRFVESRDELEKTFSLDMPFGSAVKIMHGAFANANWWNDFVNPIEQHCMPYSDEEAQIEFDYWLSEYSKRAGFEGIMVRKANSEYETQRSYSVLKIKPRDDDEATVIGCISGREGKTGKLLGKMGALIVKMDNGTVFELSGFTDVERILNDVGWALTHPGLQCPEGIFAIQFPIGTRVSFKYRGLTNDGVPQEAQYFRKDLRL